MAKKPTWTSKGTTHQRSWGTSTLCGLTVPYKSEPFHVKSKRRRVQKDRKPRTVTCLECIALLDAPARHVSITDALFPRGLTADVVYYDEAQDFK